MEKAPFQFTARHGENVASSLERLTREFVAWVNAPEKCQSTSLMYNGFVFQCELWSEHYEQGNHWTAHHQMVHTSGGDDVRCYWG